MSQITLTFPDGNARDYPAGVTAAVVAAQIAGGSARPGAGGVAELEAMLQGGPEDAETLYNLGILRGEAREAGYDDGAIAEVIAHVALNVFTNYFNLVADTDIDFPKAEPLA